MELTIKHLAPYFPYKLKGKIKNYIVTIDSLHPSSLESLPRIHGFTYCSFKYFKPILRPVSDLLKDNFKTSFEIVQDEKEEDSWVLEAVLGGHKFIYADFQNITYRGMEFLFSNQFDVFSLIEAGLAIDINTLENGK